MKLYLLTAGDSYYPSGGSEDWIGCFETREEIENLITRIEDTRIITRGKRKGEEEKTGYFHYIINGRKYDWCSVIDLKEWVLK